MFKTKIEKSQLLKLLQQRLLRVKPNQLKQLHQRRQRKLKKVKQNQQFHSKRRNKLKKRKKLLMKKPRLRKRLLKKQIKLRKMKRKLRTQLLSLQCKRLSRQLNLLERLHSILLLIKKVPKLITFQNGKEDLMKQMLPPPSQEPNMLEIMISKEEEPHHKPEIQCSISATHYCRKCQI